MEWKGNVCLDNILKKVKNVSDNENLIVNLISLEIIEDDSSAIIAYENDAVKKHIGADVCVLEFQKKQVKKCVCGH